MIKTGVKRMRQNLAEYLNRVEQGEEILITKRNEPIAKLIPVQKKRPRSLSSHESLRSLIRARGRPLSQAISEIREERF